MAYRWGHEGPGFEFPTPYIFENRFLRLRGWALLTLALLLTLLVLLLEAGPESSTLTLIDADAVPGSTTPHLFAAFLLAVFGGIELWRAASQRRLLLLPGQPASLTSEVRREASAASSGTAWLMQALDQGRAAPRELSGPYRSWLGGLAGPLGMVPQTLANFMQIRLAQLVGLGVLAVFAAATWAMASRPPSQALAALACGALGVMLIARSAQGPDRSPLGRGLLAGALVLALLAAAAAWFVADKVPRSGAFGDMRLSVAAVVLLAGAWLVDLLGLLAARAHFEAPPAGESVAGAQADIDAQVDTAALMREIDLVLHGRWTEGVPNRRHAWQPPDAWSETFQGLVLEESQPALPNHPAPQRSLASLQSPRTRGLWLLNTLGLLSSIAGGVVWLWLARAHLIDSRASWAGAALGLALIIIGGHAYRVAHFLWSRAEAESTLTCLELTGNRAAGALVRTRVARVRSVFYAAAGHALGSRSMLALQSDTVAAKAWVQQVQALTKQVPRRSAEQASAPTAGVPRPGKPREAPSATPPRPPRFCSACGTPLLQGARFCQNCGHVVGAS